MLPISVCSFRLCVSGWYFTPMRFWTASIIAFNHNTCC